MAKRCISSSRPQRRKRIAARFGVFAGETLVVSGAQQGLDLFARCLLDPGDVVVMDRSSFLGAIQVFRSSGVHVVGWEIVRADPDELEDLVLRYHPKLLYTNPTFNNPTSRTLTLPERRELLEVARRYRLPVIEDQTYREMWFSAPPPLTLLELDRQEGDGGIYLWCRLGAGIDSRDLTQIAATSGVGIVKGDLFYPDAGDRSGADEVRLCFAAVHPDRMGEGMRRLEHAIGLARSNTGALTRSGPIP